MRKSNLTVSTLGLLAALLFTTVEASAQRKGSERPKEKGILVAKLEAIDAAKRTVTISIFSRKDGESTEKTFPLAKDAQIKKDGVAAKLTDLKAGARATLQLSPDETRVLSISVVGRTFSGDFFDAGKKTIVITVEARGGVFTKSTHPLAKEVKVDIDGKAASLSDLREGMSLSLTTAAGSEEIILIQSRKDRK